MSDRPGGWARRSARYLLAGLVVVGLALAVGWPLLGEEGRRGLLLAVGITLPLQLLSFGALATRRPGSAGFMVVWAGSTLGRFVVIGGAALIVAGMEGVDLAVTLVAMAGLFFVLLLAEPWALRGPGHEPKKG
jgi:hypothetical protein